ncbi:MAG TPA: mandelate racemase/muconate lactonizing enzyme family protein [Candidatus Limnocylindrales bacterium]|jgi:L-alanine-DL-glutamate epimerase-like enolase superfamily enzyme|nr:mandelate racemase/muconate lactonizing enzyme family protein [Candidatus Limnocylindrales bacterium]
MRISQVRTVLVTAPWTGDPFWATGEAFSADGQPFERTAALVVVETDEGMTGLGEPIMGYFAPDVVGPIVDYYGRLLVELGLDPLNPEACWRELYQRSLWWGRVGLGLSVLSGVEMALWDIAGKAAGRPVHELIGGPAHDRLPLYASGGTGSWPVQKTVDQARRYASLGFRGLKIGTGFDGRPGGFTTQPGQPPYGTWYAGSTAERVADERAKFGAIREALGPGIELATDGHAVQVREQWSRATALDLARALEEFDLLFFEEPLRYDDPEGYAELRRRTKVPIAGGECLTGVDEFRRFLDAEALDYVQPDATHAGGIAPTREIARMAEERHVGLIVHTGAAVGPGFMANLHVAFASPNSRFVEYALAPDNVRAELLVEPVALEDGFMKRPTAPGLGVALPEGFVDRYPYKPGALEYA